MKEMVRLSCCPGSVRNFRFCLPPVQPQQHDRPGYEHQVTEEGGPGGGFGAALMEAAAVDVETPDDGRGEGHGEDEVHKENENGADPEPIADGAYAGQSRRAPSGLSVRCIIHGFLNGRCYSELSYLPIVCRGFFIHIVCSVRLYFMRWQKVC